MTVVLYAITPHAAGQELGSDVHDAPLRAIDHDEMLSAIVGDPRDGWQADGQTLWAYEQTVERLMQTRALLPARFGTIAESESEIRTLLADRQLELLEALERVDGAAEYAVHLPAPPPASDSDKPGTTYMSSLLDRRKRLQELAQIARACDDRGAFLVGNEDADAFVSKALELGATVTGPWPPYSFVETAA